MPRRRSFEPEEALRSIMEAFWAGGYEGTSIQDLEAAAGLKKQSLYRLFGDKRGMYLAALGLYEREQFALAEAELGGEGTVRERFERLLDGVIARATEQGDRRGCLICNASVDQAALDAATGREVTAMLARLEAMFERSLAGAALFRGGPAGRRRAARKLLAGYVGLRVLVKTGLPEALLQDAKEALLEGL
ncbi:transcriptional regulator, TetR family [Tistlia consotensis]|uniref:Transcriptional regulator, TetR family n=1 Tax=Tistlia consotensis USBA 355 TaxID=560819 RepID=A0A1Y6C6S8_9PROT|nr:TetR/AcrR family transcriptional regulator [Tistlia consotensis]SMF48189.1 transcriptional regulator, TetR family [Tistlia consotensis USBA 355]SNR81689.1 transcriptional regulator, TetR family [Tistlia consotensis]